MEPGSHEARTAAAVSEVIATAMECAAQVLDGNPDAPDFAGWAKRLQSRARVLRGEDPPEGRGRPGRSRLRPVR